jgi:hypothetical protein
MYSRSPVPLYPVTSRHSSRGTSPVCHEAVALGGCQPYICLACENVGYRVTEHVAQSRGPFSLDVLGFLTQPSEYSLFCVPAVHLDLERVVPGDPPRSFREN